MKKGSNRRLPIKELRELLKFWQQKMKLLDWDIRIRYASKADILDPEQFGDGTLGQLDMCWPDEKVAQISIHPRYHKADGYNIAWNLDTLIIHELIHTHLSEKSNELPEEILVGDFEEFVCNSLGKIIYDCTNHH